MSERHRPTGSELAAVILAAVLVWGPFIIAPIKNFVDYYWPTGTAHQAKECCEQSFGITYGPIILSAGTLGVLIWQAFIYTHQARILWLQANIQQRQHTAIHRPRLIVRRPRLMRVPWGDGEQILVEFEVVNIGGTSATGHLSVVNAWNIPRGEFPYIGAARNDEVLSNKTIVAGSSRVIRHMSPVNVTTFARISATPLEGETRAQDFLFAGVIVYTDENMTMYRTGIWRTYDFDAERFVKSNDPDYEYQD